MDPDVAVRAGAGVEVADQLGVAGPGLRLGGARGRVRVLAANRCMRRTPARTTMVAGSTEMRASYRRTAPRLIKHAGQGALVGVAQACQLQLEEAAHGQGVAAGLAEVAQGHACGGGRGGHRGTGLWFSRDQHA